jgi:hypothetical protein
MLVAEAKKKQGRLLYTPQEPVNSHTFLSQGRTDTLPSPVFLLVFSRTTAANTASVSYVDRGFFGRWSFNGIQISQQTLSWQGSH